VEVVGTGKSAAYTSLIWGLLGRAGSEARSLG
jgi:hypothetical protein